MRHTKLYWFFCDVLKWVCVLMCAYFSYGMWTWELQIREGYEISGRIMLSVMFVGFAVFTVVLAEWLKKREKNE